jgi:hypothetical protein
MLKLSKFTVDVLKNFASINPNLVIKEGSTFSTIAEAKNIMATVQVPETFSKTFGVYDLNEFISAMGLLEDANIELLDDMAVLSTDSAKVKYRFANPSVLTTPQKEIKMPSTDIKLAITSNTLNQIRKAASVLGHSVMALKGTADGNLSLSVLDPKDASANTYNIELSEKHTLNKEFSLEFLIDNLKLFSGNYNVEISSKLISQWTHAEFALTYFIALEKSSTI